MVSRFAGPHPRRTAILDLLHERPGLCLRELGRELGIQMGTLRHHLSVLIRGGSVWTTQRGLRVLHFPADVPRVPLVAIAAHVLDELDRQLLDLARRPINQKGVLDSAPVEVPRSTVQHRLRRLVAQGLLAARRQGRLIIYEAQVRPQAVLPVGVAA
jgi:predicted transcriptional regulator